MSPQREAAAEAAFRALADAYLTGEEGRDRYIVLKREHSLRVWDNARAIAHSLSGAELAARGVADRERFLRLSSLAALFHDAGRFPQFAEYGTYHDRDSINHGVLGVRTLKRAGLPRLKGGQAAADRKAVLAAVALHNKRFLPRPTPTPEGACIHAVTAVVRDADKVDIFPVLTEQFKPGAAISTIVTLNLSEDPLAYTESVYRDVVEGRLADYGEMRWLNDFKVLLLGWVNDLNFAASHRLMVERGLIAELAATLPESGPLRELAGRIQALAEARAKDA